MASLLLSGRRTCARSEAQSQRVRGRRRPRTAARRPSSPRGDPRDTSGGSCRPSAEVSNGAIDGDHAADDAHQLRVIESGDLAIPGSLAVPAATISSRTFVGGAPCRAPFLIHGALPSPAINRSTSSARKRICPLGVSWTGSSTPAAASSRTRFGVHRRERAEGVGVVMGVKDELRADVRHYATSGPESSSAVFAAGTPVTFSSRNPGRGFLRFAFTIPGVPPVPFDALQERQRTWTLLKTFRPPLAFGTM
jgi:hypothetical protein